VVDAAVDQAVDAAVDHMVDARPPDAPPQCTRNADCDDGNICTVNTCDDGMCNTRARDCSDNIRCTVDTCDPAAGGCVHTPSDSRCDDGDPCTADHCDPSATGSGMDGCVHVPIPGCRACTMDEQCTGTICARCNALQQRSCSLRCGPFGVCVLDQCGGCGFQCSPT
jgi:hypothetical protein